MEKAIGVLTCLCVLLTTASSAWCQQMQPKAFENKLITFTERVLDGAPFDFVGAKKELVEDMYRTTYSNDFYAKYEAVVRHSRGLSFDIERRLAASKNAEQFKKVKDRYAEWNDFCLMADRAPEDMQKGVIQEYLMDKKREGTPPFEIVSAKWEPKKETSANIQAYTKELNKAEEVLKKALSALKSKK